MKINAISIVPQDIGCNARCKYCIAHLTKDARKGLKKPGISLPKLEKCFKYVKNFGATTGIITSSGETLLGSWTNIENILWLASKYFGQIDLHTNGIEILNPPEFGRDFSQMLAPYLTNITVTVPHYNLKKCTEHGLAAIAGDYEKLFKKLNNMGLTVRLSCVICKNGIATSEDMEKYIRHFGNMGVSQIVFRELWIPNNTNQEAEGILNWCNKNFISQVQINEAIRLLPIVKELNWWGNGQPYEVFGVSVSSSTCTHNVTKEIIKSTVYRPDNFLYPDWDTKCRIM